MQFKIPFQKNPSDQIKSYVSISLSSEGIREAENFDGQGQEFEVLAALLTKRPQSIGSVAKAANMSFNDCLKCCKELKNKGLVVQVPRQQ
jgi:hypothetical protein